MFIVLEVTIVGLAQASEDARTHVIASPLESEELLYVLLLVPTLAPFSFH
jgi:hypothetical protein